MQDAPRMRALVDRLNETARAYYVLDNPVISDKEWDALYDELARLEEATGVCLPDSPTRRVGAEPLAGFAPYRHEARLWSMDKAQTEGALREWAARAQRLRQAAARGGANLPPIRYVVEYKLDGLNISLTYDHGVLTQAATRGNGEVGEVILEQARTIRSLPLAIPFAGHLVVQGEGIMRLSTLAAYNRTAAGMGVRHDHLGLHSGQRCQMVDRAVQGPLGGEVVDLDDRPVDEKVEIPALLLNSLQDIEDLIDGLCGRGFAAYRKAICAQKIERLRLAGWHARFHGGNGVDERIKPARGGYAWIQVAQRAGRGVARVF